MLESPCRSSVPGPVSGSWESAGAGERVAAEDVLPGAGRDARGKVDVAAGHVLLDVNMATASDAPRLSGPLLTSPTERGRATVALAQVAVAFELKDVPED